MNYLLAKGNALRLPLPAGSVDCVVTSPPYFQLRSYLKTDDPAKRLEIGAEKTLAEYCKTIVAVFREIRRVLKEPGCVFLNLGDSYCSEGGHRGSDRKRGGRQGISRLTADAQNDRRGPAPAEKFKPKDRLGVPHRVVFALQDDGWYWRDEIIWEKKSPMPESVTDRTTKSHEFVFLLTKRPDYYYNAAAIKEPMAEASAGRYKYAFGGAKNEALVEANREGVGQRTRPVGMRKVTDGRNARSVWSFSHTPFKGKHYALMPRPLAARCVKAGCPPGGLVLDPFCGLATTGVACEALGRRFVGLDLSRDYLVQGRRRLERPHAPQAKKPKATPGSVGPGLFDWS